MFNKADKAAEKPHGNTKSNNKLDDMFNKTDEAVEKAHDKTETLDSILTKVLKDAESAIKAGTKKVESGKKSN